MDEILAQETRTTQAWDDYAVSLVKIGDIHKAEREYAEAVRCYEKACGIFETNVGKTGSLIYMDHYAGGVLLQCGGVLRRQGADGEGISDLGRAVRQVSGVCKVQG